MAIVAVGVALSLWATGVLGLDQALEGFGDPTVVFIASLFVVTEGLEASGVTAWAGRELVARAGASWIRLVVATMGLVAVLTALTTPNASVLGSDCGSACVNRGQSASRRPKCGAERGLH